MRENYEEMGDGGKEGKEWWWVGVAAATWWWWEEGQREGMEKVNGRTSEYS